MEPKEALAANLRRLRLEADLTQMEVSNRSGLDMAEISRIERATKDIRLSTLVRLARGLGVPATELVAGIT